MPDTTKGPAAASKADAAPVDRFEDQLARLEAIVDSLEDESVGLEEALDLFERGMQLAKACRARLESVEARVQKLLETADGEVTTEPLDPDAS